MALVYGAFAFLLVTSIFVNIWIRRRGDVLTLGTSTLAWLMVGVSYLLIFVSLAYSNDVPVYLIYFFQMVSVAGFVWYYRILEHRNRYVPVYVPGMIVIFIIGWTLMGFYMKMSEFAVMIPSSMVLALTSMMLSAYYFMRTEREIQLKSIIGIMFALMSVVKLLYVIDTDTESMIYFVGLFVLDFIIYINASVLVFLSGYYKVLLNRTCEGRPFGTAVTRMNQPTGLFDVHGRLIFKNRCMEDDLSEIPEEERTAEKIIQLYCRNMAVDGMAHFKAVIQDGEQCQLHILGEPTYVISMELSDAPKAQDKNVIFTVRHYSTIIKVEEERNATDGKTLF